MQDIFCFDSKVVRERHFPPGELYRMSIIRPPPLGIIQCQHIVHRPLASWQSSSIPASGPWGHSAPCRPNDCYPAAQPPAPGGPRAQRPKPPNPAPPQAGRRRVFFFVLGNWNFFGLMATSGKVCSLATSWEPPRNLFPPRPRPYPY